MSFKVCLLTDHHISVNPRVWKEALFFRKRGYDVLILSMWQSKDLLSKDISILEGQDIRYETYLNLIAGEVNALIRFYFRLRKRLANEISSLLRIETGWAISHAPELMIKKALSENADLYIAHLECAFFAGRALIKAGKKVAFDFEDWYSRDYLVRSRPVALLAASEKYALFNGVYCTTTSQAMADALQLHYRTPNALKVIYNGFPQSGTSDNGKMREEVESVNPIKLLWFSRTIGPERGIEYLLKALATLSYPVEVHLLGNMVTGYDNYLNSHFSFHKGHKIFIHSFMPQEQLQNFISQFSVGLAIEENINDNKSLTISNKILQYLQAGIPVLATSTKGQQEVARHFPQTVKIIDIDDTRQWGRALEALKKVTRLEIDQQLRTYDSIFSWRAQESKLLEMTEQYL